MKPKMKSLKVLSPLSTCFSLPGWVRSPKVEPTIPSWCFQVQSPVISLLFSLLLVQEFLPRFASLFLFFIYFPLYWCMNFGWLVCLDMNWVCSNQLEFKLGSVDYVICTYWLGLLGLIQR